MTWYSIFPKRCWLWRCWLFFLTQFLSRFFSHLYFSCFWFAKSFLPTVLFVCKSVGTWVRFNSEKREGGLICLQFLDASTHLYKRLCPSVGPSFCQSVRPFGGPSIRWSVTHESKKKRKSCKMLSHCIIPYDWCNIASFLTS